VGPIRLCCIEKIDGVMALEIRHAWDYGDVPEGTAPTILGIHYAESPDHTPRPTPHQHARQA